MTVPSLFKFQGNPDFRSETLTTLEAGYRYYPASNFFLDITSFYNIYNHIFTGTMGTLFLETTFGIPHGSIPVYTDNKMAGNIMGSEVFLDYQISQWWHTSLAYTLNEVKMHLIGGSIDSATVENAEGQCPHHQVFLKSSMNFLVNTELDIGIRYVDALPELGIKSYINLDLRLGWHLSKKIRLDFIGQNLLYENFLEFIPEMDYTIHTCVQRGIYCKITWQF